MADVGAVNISPAAAVFPPLSRFLTLLKVKLPNAPKSERRDPLEFFFNVSFRRRPLYLASYALLPLPRLARFGTSAPLVGRAHGPMDHQHHLWRMEESRAAGYKRFSSFLPRISHSRSASRPQSRPTLYPPPPPHAHGPMDHQQHLWRIEESNAAGYKRFSSFLPRISHSRSAFRPQSRPTLHPPTPAPARTPDNLVSCRHFGNCYFCRGGGGTTLTSIPSYEISPST